MFGFPQALDVEDMDGGAESEQAMLPSSMSLEYQDGKPNGAIHGFDMNSGLSVCEHLRGKDKQRRTVTCYSGAQLRSETFHILSIIFSSIPSYPTGDQAPAL